MSKGGRRSASALSTAGLDALARWLPGPASSEHLEEARRSLAEGNYYAVLRALRRLVPIEDAQRPRADDAPACAAKVNRPAGTPASSSLRAIASELSGGGTRACQSSSLFLCSSRTADGARPVIAAQMSMKSPYRSVRAPSTLLANTIAFDSPQATWSPGPGNVVASAPLWLTFDQGVVPGDPPRALVDQFGPHVTWVVSVPTDGVFGNFYCQAINAEALHRARPGMVVIGRYSLDFADLSNERIAPEDQLHKSLEADSIILYTEALLCSPAQCCLGLFVPLNRA